MTDITDRSLGTHVGVDEPWQHTDEPTAPETAVATETTDKVTPTHDIARRLKAGETLTSQQTADEYGVTKSLLGQVIRDLKVEGHEFRSEIIQGLGNPKQYTLILPTGTFPDQGAWGKGPNVSDPAPRRGPRKQQAKAAAPTDPKPKAAATPRKRKGLEHPVPELGSDLAVNALTLTERGVVALSIENDTGMWLVEVVGYAKKQVPDG